MNKKTSTHDKPIAVNKKASHDYFFEERFEAGVMLLGWEVKSLRAGRAQLVDSYVILKDGEAWLLGALINPLPNVPDYLYPDPQRTRKLLLNKKQLKQLSGAIERKGYTLIATKLYWKKHLVKVDLALAKGKKQFDKRATIKDREWKIDKQRGFKERHK